MKIKAISPASKRGYPSSRFKHSQAILQSYASPGTEVTLTLADAPPEFGGIAGLAAGHLSEPYTEAMGPFAVKEAIKAEKEGFDGFLFLGQYNVGAEWARHMVNIPVVDTGTATLHVASLLGDRICALVPHDMGSYARRLFRRWGMNDFVTSVKVWHMPWHMPVDQALATKAELTAQTIKLSKTAIEQEDAHVIATLCGAICPMIVSAEEIEAEVGVPVLDPYLVGVKMTEMFVNLKVKVSRKAYPFSEIDMSAFV